MPNLPLYKGPLFKLILGKYPVLRVVKKEFGTQAFSIKVGDQVLILNDVPRDADVREGDLLSLYTEVALAIPSQPQKQ